MLTSLNPEEQRTVYAGAFLPYARELAGWSPPPLNEPGCRCARCAPVGAKPHRGTEAWRKDSHQRHRVLRQERR